MPNYKNADRFWIYLSIPFSCLLFFTGCSEMQNSPKLDKIRRADPEIKYNLLKKDYTLVHENLRAGMTKDEVQVLLGNPQNSNTKYVWMWCEKYDENKNHKIGEDWQTLGFCRSGFYLVFYNDKLQHRYLTKNSEADPWEILSNSLGMPTDKARTLILAD